MKEETITVTEASRNFADCVNRAHYQKTSFVLLKNGVPFARLVPEAERKCTGAELAAGLASATLSAEDALAWSKDLKQARKTLKPAADKWR
jgi:prevent-host-death family protein